MERYQVPNSEDSRKKGFKIFKCKQEAVALGTRSHAPQQIILWGQPCLIRETPTSAPLHIHGW